MKVKLFQIAPEKDEQNLMFMNYDFTMKKGGICEDIYELVFDGELNIKRLDDVYYIFNSSAMPCEYRGRCMSVSDVVWIEGLGTFFCDSVGYKQIQFNQQKCIRGKFK